ncbi:MAG TPA: efflux RND transporter periplasmic adaptor subunit [Anaerovoracaceae bacterium]|nr:efflux RND transporter periplasmic adaptor subunit [Anaerovoracaceae bacterium]
MKKNAVKIVTALMVASMVMILPGCSSGNDQIKVKTAEAETGQIEAAYTITGALVPAQVADISAQQMGKVSEVNIEVGDTVNAGQVLARLDDTQLSAQLNQAQASYQGSMNSQKQAKINLDNAAATLERTKALYTEGAVAKVQMDADQKAYDLAKSQYDSSISSGVSGAKASVDNISAQVNNSIIKSPISGVIVSKNITAGETATVGSTLMTVADMSSLMLKGTISQAALPYIKKGDTVDLFIDIYPDQTFKGTVSEIGSMSVSTGAYFPIEISMQNTDQFASGISAHADISAKGAKHMIVPASAIVDNNGENYLFVIEDGIAKKTMVLTGLKNDDKIEILKGLKGGEAVAVTNANHLFDGMPVQIVKD